VGLEPTLASSYPDLTHFSSKNSSSGSDHHIEFKFQLNLHQILPNVQKCAKKSTQLQFRQFFLRSQSSQNKNDDNKQSIHNMNINRVVRHIKYTRKKTKMKIKIKAVILFIFINTISNQFERS